MTRAARNGCVCADSNGTKCDVAAWNWEGFAAWTQRQLWCPELTFGPVVPTFLNTGWAWYPSGPAGLHFRGCKYLNCGSLFQIYPGFNCFFFFLQATNKGNKMHKKHQNRTLCMKASPENTKAFSSKGEHCKSLVRKSCVVSEDTSSLLFVVFHVCMSNHWNNIELRKWAPHSKV